MTFTPEEIKEGEELIEQFTPFMHPFHQEVARKQSIKCAIITQKIKIEAFDCFCYGRKQEKEKILFVRRDKAKRVIQYLESL